MKKPQAHPEIEIKSHELQEIKDVAKLLRDEIACAIGLTQGVLFKAAERLDDVVDSIIDRGRDVQPPRI